jgi:hypothetical protein
MPLFLRTFPDVPCDAGLGLLLLAQGREGIGGVGRDECARGGGALRQGRGQQGVEVQLRVRLPADNLEKINVCGGLLAIALLQHDADDLQAISQNRMST